MCSTTLDRRNRTTAVMRSEVRHEDGRLLVTAIGSYTIFPRRRRREQRPATGDDAQWARPAASEAGMSTAMQRRTPVALTIAGSDSGGGAGIQADLKAFARCGVHGCSAITAITAQNTLGVQAIHAVPPDVVLAQVRAVLGDIGVDAVKVGMLGTVPVTFAVARALDELPPGTPVVVDPVMVAESGARLLDADAQGALVAEILPRATVLTPNLPEARVLAGSRAREDAQKEEAQAQEREDRDEQEAREERRCTSRASGARARAGRSRAHRGSSHACRRSVARFGGRSRDPGGGDPRRAPSRRRRARLRVHALRGAGGAARAR